MSAPFLEIELKLTIDPSHISLLKKHALFECRDYQPPKDYLVSRYFDTSRLNLWRQGLSLRIREADGRMIQTLKTSGERIGDLHHRHEWDQPIQTSHPDIQAFSDQALIFKLNQIIDKNPLIELFQTRFERTQWCFALKENNIQLVHSLETFDPLDEAYTLIELVLDQGSVHTVNHQTPLNEIELELKKGDAKQLYKLADIIKEDIPLQPESRSKAQRGYDLYKENSLQAPVLTG